MMCLWNGTVEGTIKEEMRGSSVISGWSELFFWWFALLSPFLLLIILILFLPSLPSSSSNHWLKKHTRDTALRRPNVLRARSPFSAPINLTDVKRPIIGHQQTIIHIIHPIVIRGRRLMMAPADHKADMMGALEQQSGVTMWRNTRRMFEHVVNRPEMWMTNDQRRFLIKLMSVLFTELCLIE